MSLLANIKNDTTFFDNANDEDDEDYDAYVSPEGKCVEIV